MTVVLTSNDIRVLVYLYKNVTCRWSEIKKDLKMSSSSLGRSVRRLKKMNAITKMRGYYLNTPLGDMIAYYEVNKNVKS